MTSGAEWVAEFESRLAAAREKAEKFAESLNTAGTTVSAKDGSVTVSVAPNGSLTDLRISDSALRSGSGAQLAALVMRTAREAQRQAAARLVESFSALGGVDSEATKMLTGYVPPPEPEPAGAQEPYRREPAGAQEAYRQEPAGAREPYRQEQAVPPTAQPQPRPSAQPTPQRPPRPARPADDDEGSTVLRSDDW